MLVLLDDEGITGVQQAVRMLNAAEINCPSGHCLVFSQSQNCFFVLWRSDKQSKFYQMRAAENVAARNSTVNDSVSSIAPCQQDPQKVHSEEVKGLLRGLQETRRCMEAERGLTALVPPVRPGTQCEDVLSLATGLLESLRTARQDVERVACREATEDTSFIFDELPPESAESSIDSLDADSVELAPLASVDQEALAEFLALEMSAGLQQTSPKRLSSKISPWFVASTASTAPPSLHNHEQDEVEALAEFLALEMSAEITSSELSPTDPV